MTVCLSPQFRMIKSPFSYLFILWSLTFTQPDIQISLQENPLYVAVSFQFSHHLIIHLTFFTN